MGDVLLEAAITNWEPRFLANGVDPSDYSRITSVLSSWNEWCTAWSQAAETHLALAEEALAHGHLRSAGDFYARAATYFHFGKFLFVHDSDQSKAVHARAVDALNRSLPYLHPPGQRVEIPFEGSTLVAVFRTPASDGPRPTVILIPGLDSTKEEFREVERAFLERGLATFALDGPGQGEAEWDLAIRPEWELVGEAIFHQLRQMSQVDDDRVGVWGVSLGGFYAARLASSDLPVRATVCLAGPYSFSNAWPGLNPLTRQAFQVRAHCATPEEAERRATDFTLKGYAEKIATPLLVIMGEQDRLFSWRDGERLSGEARGETELLLLPEGNHGCANLTYRHRPYSADWLGERLGVANETP